MRITVNGETRDFPGAEINVSTVLVEQKVESPDMVAVQVNGAFVDKGDFDSLQLQDGDNVEFLYFMGGGAEVGKPA
ncbi:sulfur carrier protein ThiS [Desulfurivibrio sp. C05AmB]|jgi:sulfur carrier protein|uniref:sulfur carrier protein ThiS n=1 Tax=Desulfurivibrio sp. C05AmB TaxID=3374371 RepID=UPI00376EDE37